jgi:predicted transposase YbfD/YdcC
LAARGGQASTVTVREPKARHGRREVRMVWAIADPGLNAYVGSAGTVGQPWPQVQQVLRVERERVLRRGGSIVKRERKVTYALTSLSPQQADAAQLARYLRGHWGIENRAHWVRDVVWDEDRCQVRSGAAPQVLAATRNLAIALLRRAGYAAIAPALRTLAGRPAVAVRLVLTADRL